MAAVSAQRDSGAATSLEFSFPVCLATLPPDELCGACTEAAEFKKGGESCRQWRPSSRDMQKLWKTESSRRQVDWRSKGREAGTGGVYLWEERWKGFEKQIQFKRTCRQWRPACSLNGATANLTSAVTTLVHAIIHSPGPVPGLCSLL